MNFKKISLAVLVMSMVVFTSCRDEKAIDATPTETGVETNENPKTTASVNPPHGQPGHRCDIPVGANLDQASTTTMQQTNNNTVSPNVSPVRLNQSTTMKNPPHGQPGHDCTKPVGADL